MSIPRTSTLAAAMLLIAIQGCSDPDRVSCQKGDLCASASQYGDDVMLYIHNNTSQDIVVPEIRDIHGPGIAFSVSPPMEFPMTNDAERRVTPPLYDGEYLRLRPAAVYGVKLPRAYLRETFQLAPGCQMLLVQAEVIASPRTPIERADVAKFGSISATEAELCL